MRPKFTYVKTHDAFETFETFIATVFQSCIQDQFLKDCPSKHVGPIVSYILASRAS